MEFPGGPVVKTPSFHSDPWQTKILQAVQHSQ